MKFKIVVTENFEKELKPLSKKYASLKDDIFELFQNVHSTTDLGTSIGSNAYKIRLAIGSKGKGKRSGARVIAYLYSINNILFLLSIYDKSETESISKKKLQILIEAIHIEIMNHR
jgi:mRNA-degrading endonuclease RelE of RelBE toxin-antitoxin system